jgi:hypothetical protein
MTGSQKMKRSKMLLALKKYYSQTHLLRREDDPVISVDEFVEGVLKTVEKYGMLPPMQEIPEHAFQAPHEWEDEDK